MNSIRVPIRHLFSSAPSSGRYFATAPPSSRPPFPSADEYKVAPIRVGHWASITKQFTSDDVQKFALLSLDSNPVHLDEARTQFGGRIVHGFLVGSLISAVAAGKLPGPGAIYLSQSLKFRLPVYLNDTITATIKVTAVDVEKHRVTFETMCQNQKGDIVISGEALTLAPKETLAPQKGSKRDE